MCCRIREKLSSRTVDDPARIHVQETAVDLDAERRLRAQNDFIAFQQDLLLRPRDQRLRERIQYDVARCGHEMYG